MKKRIHWAWIIFIASFITVFINQSTRFSYYILMPEMIVSLKISKTQAGAIVSSFYLAYTIFTPLLGYLVDRVSARKILVLFCFIQGTGAFLMGKSVSLTQASLFFAIVGVGSSAMWIPIVTLVQRWFGVRRRGMALGILSTSFTIGYGTMGLILPLLVARFDWRACWLILSAPAFALMLINGFLLRAKPQDLNLKPWGEETSIPAANPPPTSKSSIRYRDLLKIRNLWLVAISYFFITFTAYVINIFIVTYGNMELGFPYAQSAKLASAIAFSGLIGVLVIPILSDSLGRKRSLILINFSLPLSILLIIFAGNRWNVLLPIVCVFGFFYASIWPMYAAAAGDFFPHEAIGSVLGFWTIFYGVGFMLAGILGGLIADFTGTLTWSFLAAAIAGGLSTFFFSQIKNAGEKKRGLTHSSLQK
jgi:sugar phosphate permease